MIIGLLLLRYRAAEGLGVREFAKQLGVSYSTLSRIENGEEPKRRRAERTNAGRDPAVDAGREELSGGT